MSELKIEVCKISEVTKHPDADKLDIVQIKGWNCIVGKDNHTVDELIVYCPPDSIIPEDIIDAHGLEYLKKNGRVGTVKLRGYISQGLVLPVPEGKYKEGDDVAEVMGITKYEPPKPSYQQGLGGGAKKTKKRSNLNFQKYTDISNIKNHNSVFNANSDEVIITEKIHGTNFRTGTLARYTGNILGKILSWLFGGYEFCYGSHNVQLQHKLRKTGYYKKNVYGDMARKYNLDKVIPNGYALYGEIFGPGIQKNYDYGVKEIDVRFFDLKYEGKYVDYDEFLEFCGERNLPVVPELYRGILGRDTIEECTGGESTLCPGLVREGCVVKALKEENHPKIGRKILKSINPIYHLNQAKNGGTDSK